MGFLAKAKFEGAKSALRILLSGSREVVQRQAVPQPVTGVGRYAVAIATPVVRLYPSQDTSRGIELVACGHIGVVHSDPQNVDGNSRDLHPLLLLIDMVGALAPHVGAHRACVLRRSMPSFYRANPLGEASTYRTHDVRNTSHGAKKGECPRGFVVPQSDLRCPD